MNTDTLDLINQLNNKDSIFTYKVNKIDDEYKVLLHWFEEGYGYFDKVIFTTRDHSELNGLLCKELDRLSKSI